MTVPLQDWGPEQLVDDALEVRVGGVVGHAGIVANVGLRVWPADLIE
jgi:hypothetical protein